VQVALRLPLENFNEEPPATVFIIKGGTALISAAFATRLSPCCPK
jgi:hypothetical protein